MRYTIAIFFFLIFSLQALPVKFIGKSLAKNQQTEEVKDDCDDKDDDGKNTSKDEKYNDLIHQYNLGISPGAATKKMKNVGHLANDGLPNSHVRDILNPPPNC